MSNIKIISYSKDYESGVINVCYRTGFNGEDLTNTNLFNDKKLFGYLFCLYYVRYEPQNAFIAIDSQSTNKMPIVVGYILGTTDTIDQEKRFSKKMIRRILLRSLLISSWKYPESLRFVMRLKKEYSDYAIDEKLVKEYPAHLHINVLPEYQNQGIGSKLLAIFEDHLRSHNVKGVHLGTSNYNKKAIPFYKKNGFVLYKETPGGLWEGLKDLRELTFVKHL